MKYIKKIDNLSVDIEKLKTEYNVLIDQAKKWEKDDKSLYDFNAISVNQKEGDPKSLVGSNVRGLYWTYPNNDWIEEKRLEKIDESGYNEISSLFKDTYVEEVYNLIRVNWKIGRMRFLMKPPRSCLSWHRDPEKRLHIPIITNPGCRMVIEDEAYHMPADGSIYITDNTKYHNFFNGGETDRIHLVATLLE